jgi:hypothetical protein
MAAAAGAKATNLPWALGQVEPKRKYRWYLQFGNIDQKAMPQWIIKTTKQPGYEVTEAEHSYVNHTFYYPGRVKWNEITITLVDPVTPDATELLYAYLAQSGYRLPDSVSAGGSTDTITKARATYGVGNWSLIKFGTADGSGTGLVPADAKIEEWQLRNPWIKNVDFGDLDYTSDDILEISLTLRYDWAVRVSHGSR